ncbi:MAG: CoA transferase, partial [Ilumatobacteraceae bacterium]
MTDRHDARIRGPLDGLVVADLSRVLAGPYATMLLADLGATVIKVESPAGDDTRTWTPPEHNGTATYYLSINRNKQSIVLDFTDPSDIEVVHELFRRSDIVVENFKTGGLAKFGLDYDTARMVNPALIYLSISGFGTAEGAWLPGYDLVVQAVSGLMSLTGDADGPAYRAGISVFDVMTGMHGAI